ncbi:hypothetical protein Fmac_006771 [Flemingia macrophylla]|uniref:Secreted protein n=1 Tax=Flemingia macrophylla TaxID=520843 RepID=A0ABD1NBJ9_9FABA
MRLWNSPLDAGRSWWLLVLLSRVICAPNVHCTFSVSFTRGVIVKSHRKFALSSTAFLGVIVELHWRFASSRPMPSDRPRESGRKLTDVHRGSVTAGMEIFDTLRHIRPDVSTVCVGLAASVIMNPLKALQPLPAAAEGKDLASV